MPEQETLGDEQNPVATVEIGLYARFRNGDEVDRGAWTRAVHSGEFVGQCECGDYLVPSPRDPVGGYEASCRGQKPVHQGGQVTGCGKTIYAPGGRILTAKPRGRAASNG